MTVAGLALPELSQYDPGVEGEGSLDPMGLAAISERLVDQLVPGLRARMHRVRFLTAMAVGASACQSLTDVQTADGTSTPAICFEWLVVEGIARRPELRHVRGVPGTQKARAVVGRKQRLSAATYLKAPSVFGFNGVYKPFAIDSRVVGPELLPAERCAELTRAWEVDEGYAGFTDLVPGSKGEKLRSHISDAVRKALEAGRCTTNPSGWLFGQLAHALQPDGASPPERAVLRSLVIDGDHEHRTELAVLLDRSDAEGTEAELLGAIRPECSHGLGLLADAVTTYERFAALLDAAFRTLCAVSASQGTQPLTPVAVREHATIQTATRELPTRFAAAAEAMAELGAEADLEHALGDFAIPRQIDELVELLLQHHEDVQGRKLPNGKRPWFEPLRDGWVVRGPYADHREPELGPWFIHPVRVAALASFLTESAP